MDSTKLTRRVLRTGVSAGISLVVAGTLFGGHTAQAQTVTSCTDASIVNPVYVTGSSAVKPFLDALAVALAKSAAPVTLVYPSKLPGSCEGVKPFAKGILSKMTDASIYYDSTGAAKACTPPAGGVVVDIGASDVFGTSCAGITAASLAGVSDSFGPNQVMQFVVPAASDKTAISAEAAYLTYGLGEAGETPWSNNALHYRRDELSGTQTMISFAIFPGIKDPALKFNAYAVTPGNAQAMVNALGTPTGDPNLTIGILASGETDDGNNRTTLKRLAYKHYGQTCAFWPDSEFTSQDKLNVREGRYAIWGPLHLLTTAAPSASVKKVVDLITGAEELEDVNVLDLAISKHIVPQCAMHVSRDAEMGPLSSFQPKKSCGCYFDANVPGGAVGTECTECTTNTQCKDANRPNCNFGYCEAK